MPAGFQCGIHPHVEATYADDAVKNDLCLPIPHPDSDLDWLRTTNETNRNYLRWAEDAKLQEWIDKARLNLARHWGPQLPPEPTARAQALQQVQRLRR